MRRRASDTRGSDLDEDEAGRVRDTIIKVLGDAIAHYEATQSLPILDKLPMSLTVHRGNGEPPALRPARGGLLRGPRDATARLSDRGQAAQGPPALATAQVRHGSPEP